MTEREGERRVGYEKELRERRGIKERGEREERDMRKKGGGGGGERQRAI